VAYRVALRVSAGRARIAGREEQNLDPESAIDPHDPSAEVIGRELRPVLDQELNRLPEKYRAPVVLCYLEGKSYEEAARQLGWSKGTVSTRLTRARELLRGRLTRRGLGLPTGLLAAALAQEAASGAVPATLAASAVRSAVALGIDGAVLGNGVPAHVASLAGDLLHALWMTKLKIGLAIVLALSLASAGAGLVFHQSLAAKARRELQPQPPLPVAQGSYTSRPNQQQPVRTDLYGDALPPGALVRMGSIRLRHPTNFADVAFSADGKMLTTANPEGIRFWDAATGKPLDRKIPGPPGGLPWRLSPDGRILVTRYESDVRLLDVNDGKELRRIPVEGYSDNFAWAADGKTLAAALYNRETFTIQAWDVVTGKAYPFTRAPQARGKGLHPIALSPNGQLLAYVGAQDTVRLFETHTGRELRTIKTAATSLKFSADGKTLAFGDPQGTVKLWDVATWQERGTISVPAVGRIVILSFSSDGRTLAVRGNKGLSLCDLPTRKERHHMPVKGMVRFAPEGKTLVSQSGGKIQLWDVATGNELIKRPGDFAPGFSVVFAPDGKTLASASSSDGDSIWLWDSATGKALLQLEGRDPTFCRDGKQLVFVGADGILRFVDRNSGKELRRLIAEDVNGSVTRARCVSYRRSPDGTRLVAISVVPRPRVLSVPYQIDVWDTATGNLLTHRAFLPAPPLYVSPDPRLSPNLRTVTIKTAHGFAIHAVPTGRQLTAFQVELGIGPIGSSADGRFLATPLLASMPEGGFGHADAIAIWELATGKEFLRLETGLVGPVAFSPEGRLLAAATMDAIHLWDIATGKEVFRVPLPPNLRGSFAKPSFVISLTFSPDGKNIATGLRDGSILSWDVAPAKRRVGPEEKQLGSKELERLWAELAADDGEKALAAVRRLAATPQTTVPFLKQSLHTAREPEPERMRSLVADLDSASPAVREAASKELSQLGDLAEPALHQALQEKPSGETRKRLEALLARPWVVDSPEVLRCLRAIQVLEAIASEEARQALQVLASGAPAARETQEAKAALERFAARIAAQP
jgi:WD40 repeat protein